MKFFFTALYISGAFFLGVAKPRNHVNEIKIQAFIRFNDKLYRMWLMKKGSLIYYILDARE